MIQFQKISLYLGPALALALGLFLQFLGWQSDTAVTAAVAVLCAVWWIFEPIPIPATSLIPLAGFPLLGVLDGNQIALSYGSPLIVLLMGGFILSTAMERSGAHRLLALNIIKIIGGRSDRLVVIGFAVSAAFLSMWISNTATVLMLLPIALAVLQNSENRALRIPLLLAICYCASVGGVGTPIGTPPNLIFMRVYKETTGTEISFLQWMGLALPVVVIFVPLITLWLTRNLKNELTVHIPATEAWTPEQKRVIAVFVFTAIAWMTRKAPFGGWSGVLDIPTANDAAVALTAVIAMFIIPNGKGGRLLDWETANRIPWGILLLFAGGIALAKAFVSSGLAEIIANGLTGLTVFHTLLMILLLCLMVTFLTEVTSNTATTSLLMPILAAAAFATKIDPMLLMVPAAMSASCAFMLPVATAPNAIIFGSGEVPIQRMVREGFVLNFLGVTIISLVCYFSI